MRLAFLKIILLFILFFGSSSAQAQKVVVLNLDAPIFNATANYVHHGIHNAIAANAVCVILKLNSAGGLLKPTQKIVADIKQSSIPIISYITPNGAHAGSSAVLIALASDVLAMSSGSFIGAASPTLDAVKKDNVSSDHLEFKKDNSFIKSIAQQSGVELKVLNSLLANRLSFTTNEALKQHLIDCKANNLSDLLKQLNGSVIERRNGQSITLNIAKPQVENVTMGTKNQILNVLNHPDVMYLLLLVGILGLLFEFFNPGGAMPGIIGFVCLLFAIYAMTLLPINYFGLALILFGMALFVLEIKFTSYGLLSIGGAAGLFFGALFLIEPAASFDVIQISWTVLIVSTLLTILFFAVIIGIGLKAQFNKPLMGRNSIVGKRGIALTALSPIGKVRVNGEIWDAVSEADTIEINASIEVVGIQKFKLTVKSITSQS